MAEETRIESPFQLQCLGCGNPPGEPWHHPKSRRCYFGEGPLWRRVLRRIASILDALNRRVHEQGEADG